MSLVVACKLQFRTGNMLGITLGTDSCPGGFNEKAFEQTAIAILKFRENITTTTQLLKGLFEESRDFSSTSCVDAKRSSPKPVGACEHL